MLLYSLREASFLYQRGRQEGELNECCVVPRNERLGVENWGSVFRIALSNCMQIIYRIFLKIKFIGVTLVNKITQVLGIHFYDTSVLYCAPTT